MTKTKRLCFRAHTSTKRTVLSNIECVLRCFLLLIFDICTFWTAKCYLLGDRPLKIHRPAVPTRMTKMVKHRNSSLNTIQQSTKTKLQTLLGYLSALQTINVLFPRISIEFCKGLQEVTKCNSGFDPEICFFSDGRQQESTLFVPENRNVNKRARI